MVGPRPRGLRATAARAVVQRRRRVRRRSRVSLGLLQQFRDPPDAAGRARCVPRRVAGVEGAGRARSAARAPLRRRAGAPYCARRKLPADRTIAGLPLWCVPGAGPNGAPPRVAGWHFRGASPKRPYRRDPAQHRGAGTFDANGWLRIGFCGHQPGIGESYISTGSLYLCAVGLLPLGLPPSDEFWNASPQPWTSVRAWSGQPFPIDKALS
jgi:hypothetical protein